MDKNSLISLDCEINGLREQVTKYGTAFIGDHELSKIEALLDELNPEGLSKWSGWGKENPPWSEAKHKDEVCRALFGNTWSIEDADALIGFIDGTWG